MQPDHEQVERLRNSKLSVDLLHLDDDLGFWKHYRPKLLSSEYEKVTNFTFLVLCI